MEPNETQQEPISGRLTQSAKGFWYVDKAQVNAKTVEEFDDLMTKLTDKLLAQCGRLNDPLKQVEQFGVKIDEKK
jgi:hypothetical protein